MVLRLVLGLSGPDGDGLATLCVGGDEKSNPVHFVIKCPSTEL